MMYKNLRSSNGYDSLEYQRVICSLNQFISEMQRKYTRHMLHATAIGGRCLSSRVSFPVAHGTEPFGAEVVPVDALIILYQTLGRAGSEASEQVPSNAR